MSWLPFISSDDVVAIHAILVPTSNGDGEILLVGGDNHSYAGNNPGPPVHHDYDHSRRFNCRTRSMIISRVVTPDFDLFCCGHAFLGDGRPLIAGGTDEFPADAIGIHHAHHFDGHRHAAIYNYVNGTLNQVADMNAEPGLTSGGGRWYPTLCTLDNGDVFIFQGHPKGDDGRHGNDTPERYQLASGTWILLPAIGTIPGNPILYPRMHVLNDGGIFVSSKINGFTQNIKINAFTGAATGISPLPDGRYHDFDCPSVLLTLNSSDSYAARILLCGGETSQVINLSVPTPNWTTVTRDGNPTGVRRGTSCATLLPTGQVVLTGGTDGVINPEIYNPVTGVWTTINDIPTKVRNYHSSALLMPDGNIWTAGGNLVGAPGTGQPDVPPGPEQRTIEIYVPPYPAGARPTIVSCPLSASYGSTINIVTNDASIIDKVVLMRCGSSTHSYNPDQRAINADITHPATGNTITATIPLNPAVAIPGYYMLFTVDTTGRPCEYAKFIRIGHQHSEIITDRSTFSVLEVDAQPVGSAIFQNAFYVVYDGFLPSELGDFIVPPSITFKHRGSGLLISAITAIHADTKFENPALPADIPQKVTFVFNILFTDNTVFGFGGATEDVTITATLFQNQCESFINLIKAPNPYMLDGPTSWLSVDLRVFQMKIGDPPRATIAQGTSGNTFIQNLLTRFNNRFIYPGDELHPFNDIDPDQNDSQLEWLETSGGARVFNYAIAKVRYKAPIPTVPPSNANDASPVKVFFRMFNTAGTAMQYDPATTYNRAGTGVDTIALVGKQGGIISSIPFFAAPRANYASELMSSQPDAPNMQDLHAAGNTESVVYFGCWLDFNQPAQVIPLTEDATHATSTVNLQTSIRGIHQCLVAEVYFPGDPTPLGATPGSSDNLSQRNLAIAHSDNPGSTATHTVQHTFEIKPSQFNMSGKDIHPDQRFARITTMLPKDQFPGPDLLMVHWNNLPAGSKIIVYMPDVKVDDILALEPYTRLSPTKITKEDDHTFSFTSSNINYIPVPGGFEKNIPGLLTIELPPTVIKGQLFKVLVQQARFYGHTRRIIGSFQFNIPVSTAERILEREMKNLSILKYVRQAMPVTDPWRLIFNRYINELADKVNGLGGDASAVPASPNDKWLGNGSSGTEPSDTLTTLINQCCKRTSILILLLVFLLVILIILFFIKLK